MNTFEILQRDYKVLLAYHIKNPPCKVCGSGGTTSNNCPIREFCDHLKCWLTEQGREQ